MNEKEEFCRSFKWEIGIDWFDLTGYSPIDENRRARIKLVDPSTVGQFLGFRVAILNKNEGAVDVKTFLFSDYLGKPEGERTNFFNVIGHCGYRWYIATPKDTRPICEAIERYIGVFK